MNAIQTTIQDIKQTILLIPQNELKSVLKEFDLPKNIPFKAEENEFLPFNSDSEKYFLIGLGDKLSLVEIQKVTQKFSLDYKKKLNTENTFFYLPKSFSEKQTKQAFIGFFKGTYTIQKEEKDQFIHPFWNEKVSISTNLTDQIEAIKEAKILAEGMFLGMDLLNMPPTQKNSEVLAQFVADLANDLDVNCTIFNKEESMEKGLTSFLSVNQGSAYEPAFITLEYKPKNPTKKIGLIGKCVTFDTGGISIKPSQNMHYMKSDMGGATTVLGTFLSVVKLELPIHLIVILPATDNAVDSKSYLPGDVILSHSGKKIEVINTDAEGRMTLADALSYMKTTYNPEVMIDLATLTGSAVRTLGYKAAALFCNNKKLENQIREIGAEIGEKTWPLPLWDEYLEDLKSDVADLKHISNTPLSDVIYAAKFLQQFTHEHPNWAHIDIAGVAFGNNAYSKDKSATGYGVQLLVDVLKS